MKKIVIAHEPHGVKGAAVQYTDRGLRREIKKVKKTVNKALCQQMHQMLSKSLSDMLPTIKQHGMAIDAYGETYTKAKFDQDLVLLAVYDLIGNGRLINIFKPSLNS